MADPTLSVPNPRLADVVGWMRKFAHEGKEHPAVRAKVVELCAGLDQGDYASECLACYYWVCHTIRYMRDVQGIEYLQTPEKLMRSKAGDCDDMSTLLAAMLMACGNKCEFVLVGFREGAPPSHVFCQVVTPKGERIVLDPVANRITKKMLRDVKTRMVVAV